MTQVKGTTVSFLEAIGYGGVLEGQVVGGGGLDKQVVGAGARGTGGRVGIRKVR